MGRTGQVALVAVLGFAGLLMIGSVRADEAASQVVRVTIEDSTFKVEALVLRLDVPVRMTVRNTDSIQHGFASAGLRQANVRVENDGVITYGRGIEGVYIGPGEEVTIEFTPEQAGSLKFRCDLHPEMKGELAVMTIGAA